MDFLRIIGFISIFPWIFECSIINLTRQKRLTIAEPTPTYYYSNIRGNPGAYSFGYDVADPSSGGNQFRSEERFPNGTVIGSYGYVDASGRPHRYRYIADGRGYRVMRDRTQRPYYNPTINTHPNTITNPSDSITWSRGKKGSQKKQPYNQQFMKRQQSYIQRPSYYATYYHR